MIASSPNGQSLGTQVRTAREHAGLSQEQLADLTEGQITAAGISRIERDETRVKVASLVILANALGVEFRTPGLTVAPDVSRETGRRR